jgi:N-carbamoyl-L-amino-acid hydrolase
MHTRRDAMAAAADAISEINDLPNRLSPDAIATVGEFGVEPNSVNVIPDTAEFTVDVRSFDAGVVQEAVEEVESELRAACDRHGTTFEVEEVWRIPPTDFSPDVREVLDAAASDLGTDYEHLVSGAGHDAKYVNEIAPTAMVFVPSVDGKTHNEAEFTDWKDCVAGANVLANATLRLAND